MKKRFAALLLALPLLLWQATPAQAQVPSHPHFAPFGCGGYCIGFLSKLHFHGPMVNYGPYSGYYPFEPYGPWTSDLRYNPPMSNYGHGHCANGNCRGGWGRYAISTLKNVFSRVNPLAHRCGSCLKLGNCGTAACGSPSCSSGMAVSSASTGYATSSVASAPSGDGCATTSAPVIVAPAPVEMIAPTTPAQPGVALPQTMPAPTQPMESKLAPKPVTLPAITTQKVGTVLEKK
jgi:hypothetical protein